MAFNESLLSRVRFVPVDVCPLCGSHNRGAFERTPASDTFPHGVLCAACGLMYMDRALDSRDVATLYAGYDIRDTEDEELSRKRKKMYALDYAYAEAYVTPSDTDILDIGCGDGAFLAHFTTSAKYGIEVDEVAREKGKKHYPDIRFFGSFEDVPAEQKFHAILLRGTIQYMPDLHTLAAFCKKRLLPKGKLILLATPNLDSILAQLQREKWVLFNPIEHRYCFGISQLQRLFSDGFAMVAYDLPYLGTPYENYSSDYKKVLAMVEDPEARKARVPFFGSMLSVVFQKTV